MTWGEMSGQGKRAFMLSIPVAFFPDPPGSGNRQCVFTSLRGHCCNTQQLYHFTFPIPTTGLPFFLPLLQHLTVSAFLNLLSLGLGTWIISVFSFAFLMFYYSFVYLLFGMPFTILCLFSNWILFWYLGVVKVLHILFFNLPSPIY